MSSAFLFRNVVSGFLLSLLHSKYVSTKVSNRGLLRALAGFSRPSITSVFFRVSSSFAVVRDTIKKKGMVALGRVVFTTREHVIADLGGSKVQTKDRARLKWDDAQNELRQTLQKLSTPEARVEAMRLLTRKLLARAQESEESKNDVQRRPDVIARLISGSPQETPELLASLTSLTDGTAVHRVDEDVPPTGRRAPTSTAPGAL